MPSKSTLIACSPSLRLVIFCEWINLPVRLVMFNLISELSIKWVCNTPDSARNGLGENEVSPKIECSLVDSGSIPVRERKKSQGVSEVNLVDILSI